VVGEAQDIDERPSTSTSWFEEFANAR